MKRIEIIISESKKSAIINALKEMNLHSTQQAAKGHGRSQPPIVEFDRGTRLLRKNFQKNITIITIVSDPVADRLIETIIDRTYDTEGKIFVYEVKDAIDLRTKNGGDSVL